MNPKQWQIKINRELQNLYLWCSVSKLSVNPTKTNIIIIPPKQTRVQIHYLNLASNGFPVNIVSSAKYLGVAIDNDFNFKDHITGLDRRMARSVSILSKLVHIFPQNIMLQLYHALVRPLILHDILIWEITFPSCLKEIEIFAKSRDKSSR